MWSRPLLRLLRRNPAEIARRAQGFAIAGQRGRELVARLGEAFIGGYNAMLSEGNLAAVAAKGGEVDSHVRPFFFEGAAMGYLPRGYLSLRYRRRLVERDLLEMDARFRYLYYVGLGFWIAVRHPRRPSALLRLEPHLNPMFFPLCHDGFGFKIGFFDYPERPSARQLLNRFPPQHTAAARQGFGRALFFVFMDDEEGFRREQDLDHGAHRYDLEFGRSLALAFTGLDRPEAIVHHLTSARGADDLAARLTGVTWALTARRMTDPSYFQHCMGGASPAWRGLFTRLPSLCHAALEEARDYGDWQRRTSSITLEALRAVGTAVARS